MAQRGPKGAFGPAAHPVRNEPDVHLRRLQRQQMTDAVHGAELPGGVQLPELVHEAANQMLGTRMNQMLVACRASLACGRRRPG
jgi:hypothetical protein